MTRPLRLYAAPEHEPFLWEGSNGGAALLVHGFPGTPVEMRPIGGWLHAAGWTTHGLLLPGFGPEFARIGACRQEEWLAAVLASLRELRAAYPHVLLVGNSMGSALALQAAAALPVSGLLLCAPFWRVKQQVIDAGAPLLLQALPQLHLFRRADFDDPRTRAVLLRFLDAEVIDDPKGQAQIRGLAFPTSVLGEVRRAGQLGHAAAPQVHTPTLILQGNDDPLAHPTLTRTLAQRIPGLRGYVEVKSGHELAHIKEAQEEGLRDLVVGFAELVRQN